MKFWTWLMSRMGTSHFKDSEFDCNDGTKYPEVFKVKFLPKLKRQLETIRKAAGTPINISSAYRHLEYNRKIGSTDTSMHVQGIAVDISSPTISARRLHKIVIGLIKEGKIIDGGVGKYRNFVHYDMRTILGKRIARWGK